MHILAALQSTVPPAGTAHAVQPMAVHPEATLLFATHVVPQRWNPALQAGTQVPAPAGLQVTVPLAGAVHTLHMFPQDVIAVLPFTMQVLGAAPAPAHS